MDDPIQSKVEHSTAYDRGYAAAGFMADASSCQYGAGTEEAADWQEGFAQWFKDNPKERQY